MYGVLGFRKDNQGTQDRGPCLRTLVHIEALKKVKSNSAGADHILATDDKGNVIAWGCDQSNQFGRRLCERAREKVQIQSPHNIDFVNAGQTLSFAINTTEDTVYAWGSNNSGQTICEEEEDAGFKPEEETPKEVLASAFHQTQSSSTYAHLSTMLAIAVTS